MRVRPPRVQPACTPCAPDDARTDVCVTVDPHHRLSLCLLEDLLLLALPSLLVLPFLLPWGSRVGRLRVQVLEAALLVRHILGVKHF